MVGLHHLEPVCRVWPGLAGGPGRRELQLAWLVPPPSPSAPAWFPRGVSGFPSGHDGRASGGGVSLTFPWASIEQSRASRLATTPPGWSRWTSPGSAKNAASQRSSMWVGAGLLRSSLQLPSPSSGSASPSEPISAALPWGATRVRLAGRCRRCLSSAAMGKPSRAGAVWTWRHRLPGIWGGGASSPWVARRCGIRCWICSTPGSSSGTAILRGYGEPSGATSSRDRRSTAFRSESGCWAVDPAFYAGRYAGAALVEAGNAFDGLELERLRPCCRR